MDLRALGDQPGDPPPHRQPRGRVDRLEMIGRFVGYPERADGESQEDYAIRVWGTSEITPGTYPKPE